MPGFEWMGSLAALAWLSGSNQRLGAATPRIEAAAHGRKRSAVASLFMR